MKQGTTKSGVAVRQFETDDGSVSLVRDDGVTYRSTSGAHEESLHIFVDGTDRGTDRRVLELGFGLGTNFASTLQNLAGRSLSYFAVEHDPIDPELVGGEGKAFDIVREALGALQEHERFEYSDDNLRLVVVRADFSESGFESLGVNAVYHDPFSVDVNPECWSVDCFKWELKNMAPGAVLATYGAATRVRRAMAETGLEVAVGPGIGRKREITFASNDVAQLADFKVITHKLLR